MTHGQDSAAIAEEGIEARPGGVAEMAPVPRESEEWLRAAFDTAAVGVAVLTPEARFLDVNDAFCRITGYSARELMELDCADLTHPDDVPHSRKLIGELIGERIQSFVVDKRYIRKDGSLIWVHNSVSATRDETGATRNLIALCQDVTDRRQAEMLLSEQKNLLELIAAGTPLGICLTAITEAVSRLQPGTRAYILLADTERTKFSSSYSAEVPASFGQRLEDAPINDLATGTCGTAVLRGEPVACVDIAADERWSKTWRDLCLAHGILGCHSQPVLGAAGLPLASLMLCFDESHEPSDWELRIARFGAHLASVAIDRDRSERALRESERLSRERLDALPVAVYTTDAAGRITYYNKAAVELSGRRPELHKDEWCVTWRLYRPDGTPLPHDECPMAVALKENRAVRGVEAMAERPDGTRVPFIPYPIPLHDESGRLVGAINTLVDISERKQAHEALRESEARFREQFENANDFIFTADLDMVITSCNPAVAAALGREPDELIGHSIAEFVPPEIWERNKAMLAAKLAGEESTRYEVEVYAPGGGRMIWEINSRLTRDGDGTPSGLHAIGRDVTKRRQAEQALRESEERYRQIVESAKEYAIITLDGKGLITSWNAGAERLLGYCEEEAVGRSGDIFFTPDDRETDQPEKEMHLARTEGRATNERWHLRKNGSRFWGSGVMLPASDGGKERYLKIFRDRTDERAAEERQSLLIAELNHRVKNTLAIVQSLAQQTFRGENIADEARQAFEGRLTALASAHNLLTRESWDSAELEEIVRDALHACHGGDRFVIDGPPVRLEPKTAVTVSIALHELCTNATKYGALSAEGGKVSIVWKVADEPNTSLALRWEERGGPAVAPPERRGFGSRMIERALAYELDGAARLDFRPEGLVCEIQAPLRAVER